MAVRNAWDVLVTLEQRRRWRMSLVAVALLGGVGGMAPVAFLGDARTTGLLAGALLGLVSTGLGSIIWVPSIVADIIATPEESRTVAAAFAHGRRASTSRACHVLAALLACVVATVWGAAAGAVGAAVAGLHTGAVALGTERGPSATLVAASLGCTAYVGAICALVAFAVRRPATTTTLLRVTQLATLAVLTVAYFAPVLGTLAEASLWAPAWPLQERVLGTPLFALDLSGPQRAVIGSVWVVAVLVPAGVALRSKPLLLNNAERED